MEYLVTMTTHVPDGTPAEAVDDIRATVRHVQYAGRPRPRGGLGGSAVWSGPGAEPSQLGAVGVGSSSAR